MKTLALALSKAVEERCLCRCALLWAFLCLILPSFVARRTCLRMLHCYNIYLKRLQTLDTLLPPDLHGLVLLASCMHG